MSASDRERWESKYAARQDSLPPPPDDWLLGQASLLVPGRALELACGLGQNAAWLAEQGWAVDAVDISPTGLRSAAGYASARGVSVNWIPADLDDYVPEPATYDLVLVARFLDRRRLPGLIEAALRPGGVLLYETFTAAQLARPESHLKNPAFTLQPGELPRLFPGLDCIRYEEGDYPHGSVARFAARKPDSQASPQPP